MTGMIYLIMNDNEDSVSRIINKCSKIPVNIVNVLWVSGVVVNQFVDQPCDESR